MKDLQEYNKEELRILSWCATLANSQGFYGRLYRDLRENDEWLADLASQKFGDMLDFILYIEQ